MISTKIRGVPFIRSLLEIGASTNIIPKLIFSCFPFRELQSFFVDLRWPNESIRKPYEIVDDLIVMVKNCYFLADFIVADVTMTKEACKCPLILGEPFLSTTKEITSRGKGDVKLHAT